MCESIYNPQNLENIWYRIGVNEKKKRIKQNSIELTLIFRTKRRARLFYIQNSHSSVRSLVPWHCTSFAMGRPMTVWQEIDISFSRTGLRCFFFFFFSNAALYRVQVFALQFTWFLVKSTGTWRSYFVLVISRFVYVTCLNNAWHVF